MSRPRASWRKHSGVTLIETLAALALLGSLVVSMVLSRGRLRDQHALAEKKLEAVQIADSLLAQWWVVDASGDGGGAAAKLVPRNTSGAVEGQPNWVWETWVVEHDESVSFDAEVIRLRILDESSLGQSIELTSVDVVLPRVTTLSPDIPPVGEGS